MTNEIVPQVFENSEFGQLRVARGEDGEPWFVAKDVCDALGLGRPHDSVRYLDDDEHKAGGLVNPLNGQPYSVVSEPGLYKLILKSRKPEAKRFKRWVTHEVLPSIRRDGGYMATRKDETPEETMARAVLIAQSTIERQREKIAELKPKALFADAVAASDGTCLVGELAKMLRQNGVDVGQNRLFAMLREQGFLGKSWSNYNVPTQAAMDRGLFRIKETAVSHADGHVTVTRTPKVTGKGQAYFMARYLNEEVRHA